MSKINNNTLWHDLLESVKISVSDAIFSTWFSQTHLIKLEKQGKRYLAEIGCPSSFVKTTLESRYFGLIQDILAKSLSSPTDLIFIIKPIFDKKKGKSTPAPLFEKQKGNQQDVLENLFHLGIRPGFTFENYGKFE